MKEIIEMILDLPSIVASVVVSWLKINSKKDLRYIKKSYKKVYYPIYEFLDKNVDEIDSLVKYCKKIINENFIYVDKLTVEYFQKLKEYKGEKEYKNFRRHICTVNSYLRKKLNYLESNAWNSYYFSNSDRDFSRVLVIALIAYGFYTASKSYSIFIFVAFAFVILTIICFIWYIKNLD